VLLAVVLIVALVSVALLGFFPGMASDAQITQSRAYWQSASPISIVEIGAGLERASGVTYPYLRIKNAGAYPVRVTGLIGADGGKVTMFTSWGGAGCNPASSGATFNISDYFYLAPGEENYLAWSGIAVGVQCDRYYNYRTAATTIYAVGGATSLCQNSSSSPGTLVVPSFGFEYVEYLDNNQQITKREIGKPLIVKCVPPA